MSEGLKSLGEHPSDCCTRKHIDSVFSDGMLHLPTMLDMLGKVLGYGF